MNDTQKSQVLSFLKRHGSITQREAFKHFRCSHLGAVIFHLRDEGYDIVTILERKDRYGISQTSYYLRGVWH